MPTNRIYIIGAGAIVDSHIQTIGRLPGSENIEIHVSDINPEALERTQKTHPHIRVYGDTASMLASPAQPDDIVIVSTAPISHCSLTLQGLESGRNVLCEKPLAMNQDEARAMLQKAGEIDRLLGCCSMRFIGQSATETLKRWLEEGKLGEVYNVNWHFRAQGSREGIVLEPSRVRHAWHVAQSKSGGGVLMDWSPYDFTTLNDVLRPVKVEVLHAWMASPVVNVQLPEGTVLDVDVEFHAKRRNGYLKRLIFFFIFEFIHQRTVNFLYFFLFWQMKFYPYISQY